MSFRFGADSTGNARVTRTGGALDPQAAGGFTVCGWFYLSADRNDFSSLVRVHGSSGGSTRLNVATASDGISPRVFTPGNTSGVAGVDAFTVGAWLWVAVTQSGTTATIYTCTPGGTMHSASGTSSGGVVPDAYTIGGRAGSDSTEWFNGRSRCVRQWATVLTPTELAAERDSLTAVKAGAYSNHPTATGTDLSDASGNGRVLTAGAVAGTTEADPPIGLTIADAPGVGRFAATIDIPAATLQRADTPGAARVASGTDTAATGIVRSDGPGAARVGGPSEIAAVGTTAADVPGAIRFGAPLEISAIGIALVELGPAQVRVRAPAEETQSTLVLLDLIGQARVGAPVETSTATLVLAAAPAAARVGSPLETFSLPSLTLSDVPGTARVSMPVMTPTGGQPVEPRDITVHAELLPTRTTARLLPSRWLVKEAP